MKTVFFTFICLINCSLFAQTPDPNNFFPSSVGNVWEYSGQWGGRQEIYRDSIDQNGFRFTFIKFDDFFAPYPSFKIDTTDRQIFYSPNSINWLYYKLNVDTGDHWMVRPETSEIQRMEALVKAIYPAIYFGRETTIMDITYYDLNWGDTVINEFAWPRFTETIAYGIGEIMYFDEEGGGPYKFLEGCIIDGDTIGKITSVDNEINSINSFELYQNYPNPFNPITTIKFSLAETQKVKLTVYSLLGEEIKVLVDGYKATGIHYVQFSASGISSGVYIYTIVANNKSTSKKLILLK